MLEDLPNLFIENKHLHITYRFFFSFCFNFLLSMPFIYTMGGKTHDVILDHKRFTVSLEKESIYTSND